MVDALLFGPALDADQLGERYRAVRPGQVDGGQGGKGTPLCQGKAHVHHYRFLFPRHVHESRIHSRKGQLHCLRHIRRRHSRQGSFFLVDSENVFLLVVLHLPVHIDHAVRLPEYVPDLTGDCKPRFLIRPVHFGHQGRQHRRTGRNLGDFKPGPVPVGDFLELRSYPLRQVMGLCRPFPLRDEIHLKFGDVRTTAQVIMAHESVEIERRADPDVGLEMGHFRNRPQHSSQFESQPCRLFQRRPVGSIHDHLQFILVVEGKHLDGYKAEIEQ